MIYIALALSALITACGNNRASNSFGRESKRTGGVMKLICKKKRERRGKQEDNEKAKIKQEIEIESKLVAIAVMEKFSKTNQTEFSNFVNALA